MIRSGELYEHCAVVNSFCMRSMKIFVEDLISTWLKISSKHSRKII